MADLEIKNLHVSAGDKQILKGVDLHVRSGEFHALMGPNGSGKSTLANVIMGHPNLEVTEGQVLFDGEDITESDPDERARSGLFMAFQYPVAIPGVTVAKYLRMVMNAHREARGEDAISLKDFRKTVEAAMELTHVPRDFSNRYLNEGFSGGEKKRMEILQLALLNPKLAVLDETDSGLDIDALNTVAAGVNTVAEGSDMGVLIITHYQRILHMVKPQFVHIMFEGRIVKQGGSELVEQLETARVRLDPRRGRGNRMSLAVPPQADFPVLAQEGLVYLDSAATSQTPRTVIEAMDRYYNEYRASIHRGVYPLAAEATEAYEVAREKVAAFAGSTIGETIFTRNATEAINLVAYSYGRANIGPDDLVVLTQMEHHSNIVPWQILGCKLAWVPVTDDGLLDMDALDAALARGPKLVAVAHVSNVLGTVNPVAEITRRAHAAGAVVVIDGAQAAPHLPLDMADLDADFYAWTGHKAYGPTGIGVLHGRRELLEAMPPFLGGGHMIARVTEAGFTSAEPPAKFEAGTMPVAEAIGLGAATDFLSGIGMDAVWEHSRDVVGYAVDRLREVPGLTLFGPDIEHRGSVAAFALDGVHPHDVAEILGREGVCVRAGHACAQPLMRRLGVSATTRASFAVHSTHEEVDRLIDALGTVRSVFA